MISHPYYETALAAAQRAGEILRKYFRTKVSIQAKSAVDFVSQADLESESSIVETIKTRCPDHQFLAEESHRDRFDAADLWVIDPLDGTSNFLHGIPQFAVSIAYVRGGICEFGVVYNPISDEWFTAQHNQGAWYSVGCPAADRNMTRLQVAKDLALSDTMVAIGFYYDRDKIMEATLRSISDFFRQNIHGVRRFGAAALDLAQLARGDYGVFMEYKLHPWDHAAGGLIVSEAGGKLTNCLGAPLNFNGPTSILASNSILHEAALAIAKRNLVNATNL
ncbi:MAG: inositol monophosphatase family protein [Planctomycetota bacterium]|nr:inositol monophosphatase family protein [Planctomycetota bacterium]